MSSIWIDLDNAPHVPFFKPLIFGLQDRGHRVFVTVRDYGYTRELIDQAGIPYWSPERVPVTVAVAPNGSLAVASQEMT
jgi:predicted glycosyltransferase